MAGQRAQVAAFGEELAAAEYLGGGIGARRTPGSRAKRPAIMSSPSSGSSEQVQ